MKNKSEYVLDKNTLRQIDDACEILSQGGIVALPTETVYGLGARADLEEAVAKIFKAKERPAINPLITHMRDIKMAREYVEFSNLAEVLAQSFWPGALTLVLPRLSDAIAPNVSAGLSTLAIRVPSHPIFLAVIEKLGAPIAAPSANRSGRLSPTKANHVKRDLEGLVDMILDGGATQFGLESTVVLVENDRVTLLRHGAIPKSELERAIGQKIAEQSVSDTPKSPGQLLRHYAPRAKLVLNAQAQNVPEDAIWIGFGDGSEHDLSPAGDLQEAAHNLFARLDALDGEGRSLHIAPIPQTGIGIAINDRLQRAAAASSLEAKK